MPQGRDEDTEAFIRDIEQRRGGSLTYRTFSTFYADSNGRVCDYGVFFYQVNDEFWFEDFEREPNILGFRIRPRKDAPKYVKFESNFRPEDVRSVRTVSKKAARNCALGYKGFATLKPANFLKRLFSEVVTEIRMDDGRTMFFQFMDRTVRNKIEQCQGKGSRKGE